MSAERPTVCEMNLGRCPHHPGHVVTMLPDAFACSLCGETGKRPCLCKGCPDRRRRGVETSLSAETWRQQYERERVRLGYILGWLTPDSFDGDESKQHEYIAHMDTAAAVRSRLENLKADLRDARAALDSGAADG